MASLILKLALKSLDHVVLDYIKSNPGRRLYQIDAATIKSHHNWGAKYVVQRLEQQGKVVVIDKRHGNKIPARYFATA